MNTISFKKLPQDAQDLLEGTNTDVDLLCFYEDDDGNFYCENQDDEHVSEWNEHPAMFLDISWEFWIENIKHR